MKYGTSCVILVFGSGAMEPMRSTSSPFGQQMPPAGRLKDDEIETINAKYDEDKQRFLDSSKVAIEKQRAALAASGGIAGAAASLDSGLRGAGPENPS